MGLSIFSRQKNKSNSIKSFFFTTKKHSTIMELPFGWECACNTSTGGDAMLKYYGVLMFCVGILLILLGIFAEDNRSHNAITTIGSALTAFGLKLIS